MVEIERRSLELARDLTGSLRALVVNGPRQAGKSTLVRQLQRDRGPIANLDDPSLLAAAREDPTGFLEQLPRHSAIDEFQRAGDPLLLALKARLDSDTAPGQMVLAGSTQFLARRSLAETLTGRIAVLDLWPLSAGEVHGQKERFVGAAFDGHVLDLAPAPWNRADYAQAVVAGGFPEVVLGSMSVRARTAWCRTYLDTVTSVAALADVAVVRRPAAMGPLLDQLAARSGAEVVLADVARDMLLDPATVRDYIDALQALYLVKPLAPWTPGRTGRAKRRPVVHLTDTALAAHLLAVTGDQISELTSTWFGPLLESYVVNELTKQSGWTDLPVTLHHYRDRDQREVDVILERGRDVVAVEVKGTATPTAAHAKHLVYLRDQLGDRFRAGIVLHTGRQRLSLGDRLAAVPVSALWG